MRQFFLFLAMITSFSSWATPEKIEVYFLSEENKSALLESLERVKPIKIYQSLAQSEPFKCIPMGEGCFHPQLGFVDQKPSLMKPTKEEEAPAGYKLKTFNSLDIDLVECREGEYFDIFCGQKKAASKEAPPFEVWFDISTSLRKTDYSKDLEHCHRRTMAEILVHKCEKRPRIGVYNTSLKEIEDLSSICMLRGTNNEKRLLRWIHASKAKHLVIVTDAEEYTGELRDFLALENSTLYGLETKSLYASELKEHAQKLMDSCKR